MKIIVPATSANLGPGFDSVGLAVSKYLIVEVLEQADKWWIEHDLDGVPHDETNLLLQTALEVKPDLAPHRLRSISDIPLARGLGSSSAIIVAGIELANQLGHLQLTAEDKLAIATRIEGHPDNVAPAIYGNLVITNYVDDQVHAVVADFPKASLLAFVPDYELKTSDSRNALPSQLAFSEAVAASANANLAVAGLLKGDWGLAGPAIEADRFHEPYRQPLVKEFSIIRDKARELGAYATYLSGAGPTVMVLAPEKSLEVLEKAIKNLSLSGQLFPLEVDTRGVHVVN